MDEMLKVCQLERGDTPPRLGQYQQVTCPKCRGYAVESSWCDHCNRTGTVAVYRAPTSR